MFFKGEERKEPNKLNKLKEREGSKLSADAMRFKLLSAGVGLSMALMIFLLISGCASQKKPLPLYKQVEVPTVKAYQDQLNHAQNYVYRGDNRMLSNTLTEHE
jgi:hypothetical protein